MAETQRIRGQLRRAFLGDAWHGPAVLESLEGVSSAAAQARPLPAAHTIWELVSHITATQDVILRRLRGERAGVAEQEFWPAAGDGSVAGWQAAVERLRAQAAELDAAIAALGEERLEEGVPVGESTVYETLHGSVQHSLYHAGQIAMLRKALGAGASAGHPEGGHAWLRHALATLAYRGGKAVRDAPAGFSDYRTGPKSRTPGQILAHIGDLLDWALSLANGKEAWHDSKVPAWEAGVARLFAGLASLDRRLAAPEALAAPAEKLFQGPIADALTHVGQIAMLRRLADAPIKGENYFRAEIAAGSVGPEQAAPRREFE
jgi:uncharacterized damage-inducible protein DinB